MFQIKTFQAERWFYLFLFVHLLLWTAVPALVRHNLPLDSIEGTIWGHQLQWGYDKNPYLNGWLTALAVYFNPSGWMIYLFSQLSVVACFWAIWQLAKKMLTPAYALIAVMILEGVQYYNFHAIDFNDNTLELGLWALSIYFFYRALTSSKPTLAWVLTGLFTGLGMMAKYYTAALLAGMVLFLFSRAENRKQLTTLPPYLGLWLFLAVMLPHGIWLCYHQFITVAYVFARASSPPSWANHIVYPLQFAWQQLQAFLPAIVLALFLLIGKKPLVTRPKAVLTGFDRDFLYYVGLGPLLLTALLSLGLGIKLRAGWGMPLLSLWGILFVAWLQPRLSPAKMRGFLAGMYSLMVLMAVGYSISLIVSPDPSSANFPGRAMAQAITQEWQTTYHTKLDYVAGSRWIGGNIEFYSADHPAVFIEWNSQRAPWIDLAELHKKGGVFVWSLTDNEQLPADIRQRFPRLQQVKILEFAWERNQYHLAPIRIGVAFLPPG
jgi:4-amino-4-deoxy-L-arabinose transferase-like glycosyltransferase